MSNSNMKLFIFQLILICTIRNTVSELQMSFVPKAQSSPCDEDQLISYLADIQIINPESILSLAIDNSFAMCKDVGKTIKTILKYVESCEAPGGKDLYMSLIYGLESMYNKMCNDEHFIKKYELYADCVTELIQDFENCNGPADWIETENTDKLCKTYRDICDCYFIKTAKVCGMEAAVGLKELLTTTFNSIIHIKCPHIERNPDVEDAMPEKYVENVLNDKTKTSTANFPHFPIILSFMLLLTIIYL